MKTNHHAGWLALPLVATVLLSSCIIPGYDDGLRYSTSQSGYNIYRSLPDSFSGDAYYYNGRYYTGGNYQTGRYNYRGRQYTSRYDYKGSYLYGGRYQHYESKHHSDGRYDTYRSDSDRSRTTYRH